MDEIYDERQAHLIVQRALVEGRCADLLNILSNGGAVTIDPIAYKLAFINADQLSQLMGD